MRATGNTAEGGKRNIIGEKSRLQGGKVKKIGWNSVVSGDDATGKRASMSARSKRMTTKGGGNGGKKDAKKKRETR